MTLDDEDRPHFRQACYLLVVNTLVFAALCVFAQRTGSFYLRVVCEAFSACYLVLLTSWAWLSSRNILQRVFAASVAVVSVVLACRVVLAVEFSPWFEVAIWYVPVTSVLCGSVRLAGFKIADHEVARTQQTFTIRSMMVATATIALLFPLTRTLVRSRVGGQLDSTLWITDALVLVVPVSAISITIVWAILSNKLFHAGAFLLAAPISGILICQVWSWDDCQSTVLFTTTVVVVTTMLTSAFRAIGFRLVRNRR